MAEAQEATERYLELVSGLGNNPAAEAMAHGRLAKIKEAQGDLDDAKESYTLQFELAQGLLAMTKSGPDDGGLVVLKGSHKLLPRFFAETGGIKAEQDWGTRN